MLSSLCASRECRVPEGLHRVPPGSYPEKSVGAQTHHECRVKMNQGSWHSTQAVSAYCVLQTSEQYGQEVASPDLSQNDWGEHS